MNNGSLDALIAFAGKDDEAALERAKKGEWEREKDMIARNPITMMRSVVTSLVHYPYRRSPGDRRVEIDYDRMLADVERMERGEYERIRPEFWNDMEKLEAAEKCLDDGCCEDLTTEEFRGIVEELCEKRYPEILERKGYSCYGGNDLYDCDWIAARDCFLALMELGEVSDRAKCSYANTLGYLYYYCRCSGGRPEYDKTLFYYTLGACGGEDQLCYKLADMYLGGRGVPRNEAAAVALIASTYERTMEEFLDGEEVSDFADAALRMGSLYRDGIGVDRDPQEAWRCWKLAENAIRKRMACGDYYGDGKVAASIRDELRKIEAVIPQAKDRTVQEDGAAVLKALVADGWPCEFTVSKEGRRMKIEGRRLPRSGDGLVRPAVVSFPKARFFDLTDSAAVYMVGTDRIWTDGGSNCFRADFCDELQAGGQVLVFERDGETTAALTAKRYRFPIPAAAAGGETLRLVSVQFEDGGK